MTVESLNSKYLIDISSKDHDLKPTMAAYEECDEVIS